MSEITPFSPLKTQNLASGDMVSSKGQLADHFEAVLSAGEEVTQEVVKDTHNWLVKRFPHLFMSDAELVVYLENLRIANDAIEKPLLKMVEDEQKEAA